MSSLTLDPATVAKFSSLGGLVEVKDQDGRVLGYFHPLSEADQSVRTPFSQEELGKRRLQRTGKPLAEIFANLPQT